MAVAAQIAGVPERTARRWVADGHVPAVAAPGGRLVRVVDMRAYKAQQHAERSTSASHDRGRSPDERPAGRPPDQAAMAGLITAAVQAAMLPLMATIQQQAEELGALRERTRALEAAVQDRDRAMQSAAWQEAQDDSDRARFTQGEGEDAPVAPAPAPPPKARPAPSWRERAMRWWRS